MTYSEVVKAANDFKVVDGHRIKLAAALRKKGEEELGCVWHGDGKFEFLGQIVTLRYAYASEGYSIEFCNADMSATHSSVVIHRDGTVKVPGFHTMASNVPGKRDVALPYHDDDGLNIIAAHLFGSVLRPTL